MSQRRAAGLAALCLLGAEAVHTAVLPAHARVWAAAGVFFALIAIAEGVLAAALLVVPGRRLAWAGIGLSVLTVLVWLVSRTVGMPFGPEAWIPEAMRLPDGVATLFEAVTAAALVPIAIGRQSRWVDEDVWVGLPAAVAGSMVVALTALAFLSRSAGHVH